MYELKKKGKVFTCKFVETGPSSDKKRIYRAAVSQRLRNIGIEDPSVLYINKRMRHYWKIFVVCIWIFSEGINCIESCYDSKEYFCY